MAKQRHSRSYHRYFENYAERQVLGPDGGYIIERVYVGKYYKAALTDQQLRRQRVLFGILFLISLAGYLVGALLAKVSAVSLVALATMPPLIALVCLAVAVFYRLTVPREMEIRSYRDSSENLLRSSMAALICLLVCFGFTLGGCLLIPVYSLAQTLPSLLGYLAAAGAALGIYLIEKNTSYQTLDPKQERPAESSPIRYEMPD